MTTFDIWPSDIPVPANELPISRAVHELMTSSGKIEDREAILKLGATIALAVIQLEATVNALADKVGLTINRDDILDVLK